MKIINKLFIILIVSVFMVSMVSATVHAVSAPIEKNKDIIQIEAKEKKIIKYKVTWNGNGGKIASKKTVTTTVKKSSNINKLPTPKRTGYTFKGWYTKKTNGKKINKSFKPTKNLILFAQWKKTNSKTANSRVLTSAEKKLLGSWGRANSDMAAIYTFKSDGTYNNGFKIGSLSRDVSLDGKWYISGNTLYMNDLHGQQSDDEGKTWTPRELVNPNKKHNYKIATDELGEYLQLSSGSKYYR